MSKTREKYSKSKWGLKQKNPKTISLILLPISDLILHVRIQTNKTKRLSRVTAKCFISFSLNRL